MKLVRIIKSEWWKSDFDFQMLNVEKPDCDNLTSSAGFYTPVKSRSRTHAVLPLARAATDLIRAELRRLKARGYKYGQRAKDQSLIPLQLTE